MPLNPNIPLAAQQANVGQGVMKLANIQQQGQDRQMALQDRNLALQDAQQVRDINTIKANEFKDGAETRKIQRLNAREEAWMKSTVPAAQQTLGFIESGDIAGGEAFLTRRIAALKEADVDSSSSESALKQLRENPQQLAEASRELVDRGIQLGIIQAPEQKEGFTLKPGEKRFNADGEFVAGIAPVQEVVKPPANYEWTPEGDALRPIKGGPADLEANPQAPVLSPAQEQVDKEFAKEYTTFIASGGIADVEKQLEQLDGVLADLEGDNGNLTGPIAGRMPDVFRQYVDGMVKMSPYGWAQAAGFDLPSPNFSDGIATRDAVEEVVQRNLRLVLGAQFTEKEGMRLIARAYNPTLSEAENAKRVRRLVNQIRTAAETKASAARYYEENGTIKGWSGVLPTLADMQRAVEGDNNTTNNNVLKFDSNGDPL